MNSLHPALARTFNILVPIFTVLAILITAVRLLVTPVFVRFEYATPNFPEDRYGFTKADRLKWAPYAVDYLVNSAEVSFLGDLTFEDGSPLYNERELSHMRDVKNLTQAALKVWYVALVGLFGLGIWASRGGWLPEYKRMLGNGGKATVLFILALMVGIALGFDAVFTGFHRIFFTGDTWLFSYSDTLIRLFPIRFWRDVFIALGVLSLAGGGALSAGAVEVGGSVIGQAGGALMTAGGNALGQGAGGSSGPGGTGLAPGAAPRKKWQTAGGTSVQDDTSPESRDLMDWNSLPFAGGQ